MTAPRGEGREGRVHHFKSCKPGHPSNPCSCPCHRRPKPEPKFGEWQPIKTAPRNGTAVLFYLEEARQHSRVHIGYIHQTGISVIGGLFAFDMPKPTHWMPLPPAPLPRTEGE